MAPTRSNRQLRSIQRCFLCLSSGLSQKLEDSEEYIDKQIDVIFLLRYCLKIPSYHCEVFLRQNGNPSTWFNLCGNCESMIQGARCNYSNAQKLLIDLKNGVKLIETKLVASFNEYDDVSDDRLQTPLAIKIRQFFLHRKILYRIIHSHPLFSVCVCTIMTCCAVIVIICS